MPQDTSAGVSLSANRRQNLACKLCAAYLQVCFRNEAELLTASDYESMTITPEQALAIIRELPELERTLVLLTAATGLRISEALGLRWGDVDFAHHQIHVRRSWAGGEFGRPKTGGSNAVVPMHGILAEFMQSWKKQSPYSKNNDRVFPSFKLNGKQPRCKG